MGLDAGVGLSLRISGISGKDASIIGTQPKQKIPLLGGIGGLLLGLPAWEKGTDQTERIVEELPGKIIRRRSDLKELWEKKLGQIHRIFNFISILLKRLCRMQGERVHLKLAREKPQDAVTWTKKQIEFSRKKSATSEEKEGDWGEEGF